MNTTKIEKLEIFIDGVRTTQLIAICYSQIAVPQFVGTVELLCVGRRSACIRQLFVHPDYRMQGIGTMLVECALKVSRAAGCEAIGLSLAKSNDEAADFYRRLGFFFAYEYDDGSFVLSKSL